MLSVGTILLEPERDEQGAIVRTKDGEIKYPRLRKFTRKNPDYPNIRVCANGSVGRQGQMMNSNGSFGQGCGVYAGAENTFVFVLVVAAAGGRAYACAFDQSKTARNKYLSRDLFYARGGFDCRCRVLMAPDL